MHSPYRKLNVSAVVVPRVTCDLPLHPIRLDQKWSHLAHIQLADPRFGDPGKIDLLLGVEVFVAVLRHGWLSYSTRDRIWMGPGWWY